MHEAVLTRSRVGRITRHELNYKLTPTSLQAEFQREKEKLN